VAKLQAGKMPRAQGWWGTHWGPQPRKYIYISAKSNYLKISVTFLYLMDMFNVFCH
jgi:hypothetical protein